MCCCEENEMRELLGVGALTDAGEFVERVHTEILTLDADITRAVRNGEAPLRPEFNFNEWNDFVNGVVGGDDFFDPDDEDYLHPAPHAWKEWRGNLSNFDFLMRGSEVIEVTGRFEQRYSEFRDDFKASGGKPTAGDPAHPGVFETPQEESENDRARSRLFTAGIVIAGLVAAGYFLSSAAPLLPRPKR